MAFSSASDGRNGASSPFLKQVFTEDGLVSADRISDLLKVSKKELAAANGMSRDALSKSNRLRSQATQSRLRSLVEILNRVLPWAGSPMMAWAWYRSEGLPGFGGLTAQQLVQEGRAEAVMKYLDAIAEGGFA